MRRIAKAAAAACALVALAAGDSAVAQRHPTTQRGCPTVPADGEVCTRYGQGRACRYGGGTLCVCRRRSARDRVPKWTCSP